MSKPKGDDRPSSPRLVKNGLCNAWDHCHGRKMVLGKIRFWKNGEGHNQEIFCTRCPARGEQSVNYNNGGKRPIGV